jgi:hypothetical protein
LTLYGNQPDLLPDDLGSASAGGAPGIGSRCVSYTSFSRGANSDTVNTSINVDAPPMEDGTIPLGGLADNDGEAPWFLNQWKNTHEYNRVDKYSDLAYDAAKKDSGLYIDTGAGNDTVTNWGSGAWDVKLGTGNDTYYSDNTGNRAVWVFNTTNQLVRDPTLAGRDVNDLNSSENDFHTGFRGHLTVTLTLPNYDGSGVTADLLPAALRPTYTSTVNVPLGNANGVVSDLEINQAIKTAINTDPVLGKLLEAVDGPANTLIVRSLIDGAALDSFDPNTTNRGDYSYDGLKVNFLADTGFSASAITQKGDYLAALTNAFVDTDGDGVPDAYRDLTGARSVNNTANRVHIENGQDVVVLSTGAVSQDVLVFDAVNYAAGSKTTVVHFDTNSNAKVDGTDYFDPGWAESFVVSLANLQLANAANPATFSFNQGDAINIRGANNQPVTALKDVLDAFFYQLVNGGYGNSGYDVTGGFYHYTDGNSQVWEVTTNGTQLIFSRITAANDNTPFVGNASYPNLDPLTVGTQPTVTQVEAGHFVWANLRVTAGTQQQPVTNVTTTDGRGAGQAETFAKIVLDYAGTAVTRDGSFTFDGVTVEYHRHDGARTLAENLAQAINNSATSNWTAEVGPNVTDTIVTLIHKTAGPVANFDALTAQLGDRATAGITGTPITDPGVSAVVDVEFTAGVTNGGNFTWHGVPVTIAASATAADVADAVHAALIALPSANWPASLENWTVTNNDGAGTLQFTQVVAATVSTNAADEFPTTALLRDTTLRPSGLDANDLHVGNYAGAVAGTADTFNVQIGAVASEVIGDADGGLVTYLGQTIPIPAGATSSAIAALIAPLVTGVTLAGQTWAVTAATDVLTFTQTTSGEPVVTVPNQTLAQSLAATIADAGLPLAQADLTAITGGYNTSVNTPPTPAITDDGIVNIFDYATGGDNNVNVIDNGVADTANGLAKVGDPVGTANPAREIDGDGDYLDFSAYDAYAVVLGSGNTNPILSVTDTAELHRYVRIVARTAPEQSGTYDFTLFDAGTDGIGTNDTSLGLIGTVDFGEPVNFERSNFILFNEILV